MKSRNFKLPKVKYKKIRLWLRQGFKICSGIKISLAITSTYVVNTAQTELTIAIMGDPPWSRWATNWTRITNPSQTWMLTLHSHWPIPPKILWLGALLCICDEQRNPSPRMWRSISCTSYSQGSRNQMWNVSKWTFRICLRSYIK